MSSSRWRPPGSGVLQRAPGGPRTTKKDKTDKGDKAKPEDKPAEAFVGCSSEKQELIKDAITKAKALAARAVVALERDFPMSYEITAMTAHFGSMGTDQKNTIIARYKEVQAKLEGKTYTCAAKGKTVKEAQDGRGPMRRGPLPWREDHNLSRLRQRELSGRGRSCSTKRCTLPAPAWTWTRAKAIRRAARRIILTPTSTFAVGRGIWW